MPLPIDIGTLAPDDNLLVDFGAGVWLMDNHKWALLSWERQRQSDGAGPYVLIHADFHWDGVDDFRDNEVEQAKLLAADAAELERMTAHERHIGWDSFIAPAVRRSLLSEVHFYCLEDNGNEVGLDVDLCEGHGVLQRVHRDVASLSAIEPVSPLIFDLCLDLFNRSDNEEFEGDLWTDDEVLAFIDGVAHQLKRAAIVTVSLSFGYSGTEDDTRHLAELVLPRLLALRA